MQTPARQIIRGSFPGRILCALRGVSVSTEYLHDPRAVHSYAQAALEPLERDHRLSVQFLACTVCGQTIARLVDSAR